MMYANAMKYWEKKVDELWFVKPSHRVVYRPCIALGTLRAATSGYKYSVKHKN